MAGSFLGVTLGDLRNVKLGITLHYALQCLPLTLFLLGFSSYAMLVLPLPNLPLHQSPFIWKAKPTNLALSLLSRRTVRHPRLTVYRRDLGAPNPGIGPHWSSRSGPPDPDYQISDLPGRRGPGAEMPNPDMRIGIQSLGLELHPPVSDDHRLWKHNYGQIWDRQQRRQADDNGVVGIGVSNIVCQAMYLSITVWPLITTSYMSMCRNYYKLTRPVAEVGGAKSELRGTQAKHNLQTNMEALANGKLHR